jgi:hypothetical protein
VALEPEQNPYLAHVQELVVKGQEHLYHLFMLQQTGDQEATFIELSGKNNNK